MNRTGPGTDFTGPVKWADQVNEVVSRTRIEQNVVSFRGYPVSFAPYVGWAVAVNVATTPVAAAVTQPIGSLASVKGEAFIAREGRLIHAQPTLAVRSGDRIITRTGASAKLAISGCSVDLAGGEMKTLGNSCSTVQTASFSRATTPSAGSAALGGLGVSAIFIGLGAVAVVVLTIAIRNNARPTSP